MLKVYRWLRKFVGVMLVINIVFAILSAFYLSQKTLLLNALTMLFNGVVYQYLLSIDALLEEPK